MDIIQYFESIRQAYQEDDTDTVEEIMKEHGEESVNMGDVEKLVSYVFSTMAGFQVALEQKTQAQFDMIVNALEQNGTLDEDQADKVRELDAQLNNALEASLEEQD